MNSATKASLLLLLVLSAKLVFFSGYAGAVSVFIGTIILPTSLAVVASLIKGGTKIVKVTSGIVALLFVQLLEFVAYSIRIGENTFVDPESRAVAIVIWVVASVVFYISFRLLMGRHLRING